MSVVENSKECPVCYETIICFASCPNSHKVCIRCFMNENIKTCPLCRHDYKKEEKDDNNFIKYILLKSKVKYLEEEIEDLLITNTHQENMIEKHEDEKNEFKKVPKE